MSFYREQTERMVKILREENATNTLLDFFTQLSRIRPLNSIALVNALNAKLVDSSSMIFECTTEREWMKRISLEDLRNHVVFVMWKEFQTIVESGDFYDDTINDDKYHAVSKRKGLLAEDLYVFLETSYYIRQICILKELIEDNFDDLSIIREPDWDIYPQWVSYHMRTSGLAKTIYEHFKLIDKLIV